MIGGLPFFWVSLPLYLDFCAYTFTKNGEDLVVTQDPLYSNDFPYLFLPKNKDNWPRASLSMVDGEEVEKIKRENIEISALNPTEIEYYYKTADFTDPKSVLGKKKRQFEKNYSYELRKTYPEEELTRFFLFWENQGKNQPDAYTKESEGLFYFCLKNLEKYGLEQVYVEVDGKLAGFAWGVRHSENNWVNLHVKVDYNFKGLSRFVLCELAGRFSDRELFSLGTGCNDPGLTQFKESLRPTFQRQYYYVSTRGKV